jgi:hypothetical protein
MSSPCIPSAFFSFLSLNLPAYASLPAKQRAAAARILYVALVNPYPHSSGHQDVFPIFWKDKQKAFSSAEDFEKTNEQLKWFHCVIDVRVGKTARGYRLTQGAKDLGSAYFKQSLSATTPTVRGLETSDGKQYRRPQKAVRSLTADGGNSTRFKAALLQSDVRIDTEGVRQVLKASQSWLRKEPCPKGCDALYEVWTRIQKNSESEVDGRVQRAFRQALAMLDLAKQYRPSGDLLPCTYVESKQGRLNAEGPINLQNCVRELRMAALKGCYDVDVDNCHMRLLAELAQRQGVETPHINHYLTNKSCVREKVAEDLGISIDDAKTIPLSLVYGAKLSLSTVGYESAIQNRIGLFAMFNARYHSILQPLHGDIKQASKAVVEAAKDSTNKQGWVINDAGRQVLSTAKQSEILAHLLQGAESEILRVCLESCNSIVLIQHDGFTCREQIDTAALENLAEEKTGYRVTFSQEIL